MTAQSKSIVIYEIAKGKVVSVPIDKETTWLTQAQISELFQVDRSVVTKHIRNIVKEGELEEKSNVQKMHFPNSDKLVALYNLDFILSVGYRVNSKRATQFRIWATKTLRDYILKGYAINKNRLVDTGIDELGRAVALIKQTLDSKVLTTAESQGILRVITDYAHSWVMMHKYDEGEIKIAGNTKPKYVLTYDEAIGYVRELSTTLHTQDSAARFVGMERSDQGLDRIIGSINQTYGGKDVYKTVEEKAAHLLYFVIKDHPLIDGNKRSGSLLFIHYLAMNGLLFRESGERTVNDNTIVALALLISQSHPSDKEIMIHLITNLMR
ncbi:MAG: virulence protein RhuM/Fic/DOC family protein [bacterium]